MARDFELLWRWDRSLQRAGARARQEASVPAGFFYLSPDVAALDVAFGAISSGRTRHDSLSVGCGFDAPQDRLGLHAQTHLPPGARGVSLRLVRILRPTPLPSGRNPIASSGKWQVASGKWQARNILARRKE